MAAQLKLVRLDDFTADIDTIDLLSGGFSLAANGYTPVVAPIGAKSVQESITLNLKGTSSDDLAFMVQDIDRKIKECQWWIDDAGVERYQVWIRVQMDGETYARQAQLLNIMPSNKVNEFPTWDTSEYSITEYQFGIERTPFWEQPYPYPTTTDKTGLDVIGGTATLSETINGDVPARLAKFTMSPNATAGRISEFWAGWKTSRFGTPSGFLSVWELDKGTPIDADTSETADATAYDGTKVTTSFTASASLILRDQLSFKQIAAAHGVTYANQRGSYMVLLRAKMSDASVARVQMICGLYAVGAFQFPIYRSRSVISGTAWSLFELGNVKIPPSRLPLDYDFGNFAFGLYAERISGSGSLDMDCLILIPIDDGAVKLTLSASSINGNSNELFQAADGSLYAAMKLVSASEAIASGIASPQPEWCLPANNEAPIIVIAANDSIASTGNVKGKTADISYTYIPRWRTLRGSGAFGT